MTEAWSCAIIKIPVNEKRKVRNMSIYDTLNDKQQEAVYHTEGPLLILAGAGSGKTRVLTHRIAYLIEEKEVNPWNIMAITFTNKAAGEMRERVNKLVGFGAEQIWVATFHSTCVRILRRYIDRSGYGNRFTIYDTDDQKSIMKEIFKRLEIDTKLYKEKSFLAAISCAKNELLTPEKYEKTVGGDYYKKRVAQVYYEYQKELMQNNALDFDDLLMKAVELLQKNPDILESYQERFRYIMIDEYQDTNTAQFQFVSLLAQKYKNLCVVGDDDQSIYKFRGANIQNILNFEKVFPDTTTIKLEQNYRSTQNILNVANEVIKNNVGRKQKKLWTQNEVGEKVKYKQFLNSFEEADYVTACVKRKVECESASYKDFAVLYRTNAQSRIFEEKFLNSNIPYKIIGGMNFYARKEIKDILAYLKTIENGRDDLAIRRIINVPKRGIGATTLLRVQEYAQEKGMSFYDALRYAEQIPGLGRGTAKIMAFVTLIQSMRSKAEILSVKELIEDILDKTGYLEELRAERTDEALSRLENLDELINKAALYDESAEHPNLSEFLEEVALVADIDNFDEESDYVVMMTLHSAKGLEFPYVYMAGMEEGLFPSYMTIMSEDPTDLEEERRLCYVGITRAMQELTMMSAQQRMVHGETQYSRPSRFLKEIPEELMEIGGERKRVQMTREERETVKQAAYLKARKAFEQKVFVPKNLEKQEKSKLGYQEGDTVKHIKYGVGMVEKIEDGGRDYAVTVNFEKAGVKKMYAAFAKLKKL